MKVNIDKNSVAYQKYMKKYDKTAPENIKKEKEKRASKRKEWWKENWISFLSLIIAIFALLIAALSMNFARLSYYVTVNNAVQEITQSEPNNK